MVRNLSNSENLKICRKTSGDYWSDSRQKNNFSKHHIKMQYANDIMYISLSIFYFIFFNFLFSTYFYSSLFILCCIFFAFYSSLILFNFLIFNFCFYSSFIIFHLNIKFSLFCRMEVLVTVQNWFIFSILCLLSQSYFYNLS